MRSIVFILSYLIVFTSQVSSIIAQVGVNSTNDLQESYQQAKTWYAQARNSVYSDPQEGLTYAKKGLNSLESMTWGESSEEVLRLKVDLCNLGGIAYQALESPQEAIVYYRKAVGMSELLQYEEGFLTATKHLAEIRGTRERRNNDLKGFARWGKDVENHLNRFFDKKPFEKSVRELERMAIEQMASMEERQKNYEKAMEYQEKLLYMYQGEGDSIGIAETQHNITRLYHQRGDFEKGLDYTYMIEGIDDSSIVIFSTGSQLSPKSPNYQIKVPPTSFPKISVAPNPVTPVSPPLIAKSAPAQHPHPHPHEVERKKGYESLKMKLKDVATSKRLDSLELSEKLQKQQLEVDLLKAQSQSKIASMYQQRWKLTAGIGLLVAVLLFFIGLLIVRSRSHKRLANAYNELDFAHRKLKTAQTKLVESEKLASLGQLTAGIAHEINNPVNFISGNIGPLQRDLKDVYAVLQAYDQAITQYKLEDKFIEVQELKDDLEINYVTEEIDTLIAGINEGASRTSEIVKGLRTFARMDEDVKKTFDVHQGIDSTLTLLNHQCKEIKMVKDYGDLPNLEAFPGKLNQVFMNVLTNAIQAMNGKGSINIKTQLIQPSSSSENIQSLFAAPGNSSPQFIQISVKDSGKGIPDEIKQRIFEPFFTTKDVGEGTGLGLPICKGIIEDHNGTIEIHSKVGKGTEVLITLPLNQEQVTPISSV